MLNDLDDFIQLRWDLPVCAAGLGQCDESSAEDQRRLLGGSTSASEPSQLQAALALLRRRPADVGRCGRSGAAAGQIQRGSSGQKNRVPGVEGMKMDRGEREVETPHGQVLQVLMNSCGVTEEETKQLNEAWVAQMNF